jgi:hypothetical protein
MRINTIGWNNKTSATKKSVRSSGVFSLGGASDTTATAESSDVAYISPMVSFAINQHDEQDLAERRKGQGKSILQTLSTLQRDVLLDRVSPQTLHSLKKQLAEDLSIPSNPKLHSILQQIELRASVEIAKYGL